MRRDQIHPAIQQCYGIFAALRRLGFASADIYVGLNVDVATVVLRAQGKEFQIGACTTELSVAEFNREWEISATAISTGRVSHEDLQYMYEHCDVFKNGYIHFMAALEAKGFEFLSTELQNFELN